MVLLAAKYPLLLYENLFLLAESRQHEGLISQVLKVGVLPPHGCHTAGIRWTQSLCSTSGAHYLRPCSQCVIEEIDLSRSSHLCLHRYWHLKGLLFESNSWRVLSSALDCPHLHIFSDPLECLIAIVI